MSKNCPFCGSAKTERTFNFNESTCTMCGCDFKVFEDGRLRIFNDGRWDKFCESVSRETNSKIRHANLNHFIHGVFNEYSVRTPEEADLLIDTLVEYADGLYHDYRAGIREQYDFTYILEAIEAVQIAAKTLSLREDLDWNIRIDEEDPDEFGDEMEITDQPGEIDPDLSDDMYSDEMAPELMGFDTDLEEDHLDNIIGNIEDDLDDVDDEVSDVETRGDLDDVEDEIDDVEDSIDDLWDAYKDGYEDEEEADMDMDMGGEDDLGLDDMEGEEDLGAEEGGDEDPFAAEGGDEGEEDLGAEEGGDEENPFESRRRKGSSLNEAKVGKGKKAKDLGDQMSKDNDNFRTTREGDKVSSYKSKDEHQIGSVEDGSDATEEEEEIPYTEESDAEGMNQFGEKKVSTVQGGVSSMPKGEDFVLDGKPDGTGLGIRRESFNGYRVGDKVFISESRDEWEVIDIVGRTADLKRERTVVTVDLLEDEIRHADRNVAALREKDQMRESQSAWERTQKLINETGCVGGVCGLSGANDGTSMGGTMVSPLSSISMNGPGSTSRFEESTLADKSEVYRYIKDNALHRSPREQAFNVIMQEFNNPLEELNTILDDAILSNDEAQVESIDNLYHYANENLRAYQENRRLKDAYALYEKREGRENQKALKEHREKNPVVRPTRREEQNNDPMIENLGRNWLNRISNGLEDL